MNSIHRRTTNRKRYFHIPRPIEKESSSNPNRYFLRYLRHLSKSLSSPSKLHSSRAFSLRMNLHKPLQSARSPSRLTPLMKRKPAWLNLRMQPLLQFLTLIGEDFHKMHIMQPLIMTIPCFLIELAFIMD